MLAGATLPVAGFEQLGTDAVHTEDVLFKTRLRQGLPLARLGAAERERAEAVVADGLLVSEGDRLVLPPRTPARRRGRADPAGVSPLRVEHL
jgi:coproporphyrinogen III oxidase-like Fe-S oxidoreductase